MSNHDLLYGVADEEQQPEMVQAGEVPPAPVNGPQAAPLDPPAS
jgi:hypothetical protein